jgi:hypothetical protein
MKPKREFAVPSIRSPFEIVLLVACIIGGIGGLINPTSTSPAVSRVLPEWLLVSWYAALIASGACTLIGVSFRRVFGLYIERIGLTLLTGICMVYAVSVLAGGGYPFAFAAITVMSFAVACGYRLRQIQRDLRAIEDMDERP